MVKTKELKKILTGNVMMNENNVLMATPKEYIAKFNGTYDGWLSVLIRGVRMESRHFIFRLRKNEMQAQIEDYMLNHGRRIELVDNPQAKAIFTGYIVSKPMVIAFEEDEEGSKGGRQNGVTMTVCTGRTLLSHFRCRRIFNGFRKHVNEFLEVEEVSDEKQTIDRSGKNKKNSENRN